MKFLKDRQFDLCGLINVSFCVFAVVFAIGVPIGALALFICYPLILAIVCGTMFVAFLMWIVVSAFLQAYNMVFPKKSEVEKREQETKNWAKDRYNQVFPLKESETK